MPWRKALDEMTIWSDALGALLYALMWIGAGLVAIGMAIEPHAGAWVAALGGACLAEAYGRDRALWPLIWHGALCFGIGIMVPSLIDLAINGAPHPSIAFLAALLGRDVFDAARRVLGNMTTISDLAFWRRTPK